MKNALIRMSVVVLHPRWQFRIRDDRANSKCRKGKFYFTGDNLSFMGTEENEIECRRCHEMIPLEAGNCPHCGASVRSTARLGAILVVGLIIMIASAINISDLWFFATIGFLLAFVGGFLLYNKRQRRTQSRNRQETA